MFRDSGRGVTLIISPLLALIRNQVEAASRLGIRAITINSTNRDAWPQLENAVCNDATDALLISPERLAEALGLSLKLVIEGAGPRTTEGTTEWLSSMPESRWSVFKHGFACGRSGATYGDDVTAVVSMFSMGDLHLVPMRIPFQWKGRSRRSLMPTG